MAPEKFINKVQLLWQLCAGIFAALFGSFHGGLCPALASPTLMVPEGGRAACATFLLCFWNSLNPKETPLGITGHYIPLCERIPVEHPSGETLVELKCNGCWSSGRSTSEQGFFSGCWEFMDISNKSWKAPVVAVEVSLLSKELQGITVSQYDGESQNDLGCKGP